MKKLLILSEEELSSIVGGDLTVGDFNQIYHKDIFPVLGLQTPEQFADLIGLKNYGEFVSNNAQIINGA